MEIPMLKAKMPTTHRNTTNRKKVNEPHSMILLSTKYLIAVPPNEISSTEITINMPITTSIMRAKTRWMIHPLKPNPLEVT